MRIGLWGFAVWALCLGVLMPQGAWAGSLRVGVVAPLSGANAEQGAAIERAVALFEAAHPDVDVVVEDDGSDEGRAATVAQGLAGQGVAAVVGHLDGAKAAAEVYQAAGVPFIASMARDRAVAKVGDRVYTANYTDDMEASRIVAYLESVLDADRIALFYADDAHSQAIAKAVKQHARTIGLSIARTSTWPAAAGVGDSFVADVFPEVKGRSGRTEGAASKRVSRFRLFGPREVSDLARRLDIGAFVVIGDAASGGAIVDQIRRADLDLPVVGSDGWNTPEFVTTLRDNSRDVYLTAGHTSEIETQAARAWREAMGGGVLPDAALHTYEALQLVAAAADDGATDAEGVASFFSGRWDADTAVAGLSSLLYFDTDGVMQRDPWFLTVHRGKLKPAFTQLRVVTDPRARWRAANPAEAPVPVGPPPAPAEDPAGEATADGAPPKAEVGWWKRLKGADAIRSAATARLAPAAEEAAPARIVTVGKTSYHLTAVVYAGIDFYRINDVNVAGQDFDVEFFLWFLWEGDVDVENIAFLNQIYSEEATWEVLREDLEGDVKYVCYKIKGTFLTPYDLREFPFDHQRLPLTLAHQTRDSNEVVLVVDHDGLSHTPIDAIYPEEWIYTTRGDYSSMYEPATTFGDPAYQGPASRSAFSVYQSEIVLKRILFPYMVTLFLPLVIMVVISLFVLLVPPHQFDARMTLVMTALLSILVFHLAQGEALPSVGYLMTADQYFMVTYVLMFVLIVKTVLINVVVDRISAGKLKWFERIFSAVFVSAVVMAYLLLMIF